MQNADYKCLGFDKKKIDGLEASGFRYTYTAKDVRMAGESYALKKGKMIYYFQFYTHEDFEEGFEIWDGILNGVTFSKG